MLVRVKCPHCLEATNCIMYNNDNMLICGLCHKYFEAEIEVKVKTVKKDEIKKFGRGYVK